LSSIVIAVSPWNMPWINPYPPKATKNPEYPRKHTLVLPPGAVKDKNGAISLGGSRPCARLESLD